MQQALFKVRCLVCQNCSKSSGNSFQFRKFFSNTRIVKPPKNPIINFCKIANIPMPVDVSAEKMNSLWTTYYFPSELKTFIFKFHHNTLGLNIRVNHFNEERDPACTFCKKSINFPCERESFEHFFWYCPITAKMKDNFFNNFATKEITKTIYFTGTDSDNNFIEPVFVTCNVFRYILWTFKLKNKLPSWPAFINDFQYLMSILCGSNKKLRTRINQCDWFRQYGDGRRGT
jgi:hypothetical protein